jgi:hypothetical protein
MSGQAKGSFESRVLTDGSKSFHLRFQLNGKRETVVLHERPSCPLVPKSPTPPPRRGARAGRGATASLHAGFLRKSI